MATGVRPHFQTQIDLKTVALIADYDATYRKGRLVPDPTQNHTSEYLMNDDVFRQRYQFYIKYLSAVVGTTLKPITFQFNDQYFTITVEYYIDAAKRHKRIQDINLYYEILDDATMYAAYLIKYKDVTEVEFTENSFNLFRRQYEYFYYTQLTNIVVAMGTHDGYNYNIEGYEFGQDEVTVKLSRITTSTTVITTQVSIPNDVFYNDIAYQALIEQYLPPTAPIAP